MSTRAIIALEKPEGGYSTAWCWNDAYPDFLGFELRHYFKTPETIQELLNLHSFGIVCGKKEKENLDKTNICHDGQEARFIKLSNKRYVLMHNYQGNIVEGQAPDGHFETIDDMLQCDLNYVYVFSGGKWTTYK